MNLMHILQIAPDFFHEAAVEQQRISLWAMAKYGGPIMIVLALMLAFAIYLFIERLVTLKAASKEDNTFMNRIKDYIYDGKMESAIKLCREVNTPSARMIEKGINRLGSPLNDVQTAIENVGNLEVAKLEKGFVIMASIAGGAPMVGFLGTVTGMILTFFRMAEGSDGSIQLDQLSGGLYQAMVTTVGGLIVGIMAYFAYNYLVSRVASVVRDLEAKTMEFMDILNEPVK